MANSPGINGGLDNWNPGAGGMDSPSKRAALLSTEAKDNPDTFGATNELKRFQGKSTKPKAPFGTQGQEF